MKTVLILCSIFLSINALSQDGSRIKELSKEINDTIKSYKKFDSLAPRDRRVLRAYLKDVKFLMKDLNMFSEKPTVDYFCKPYGDNTYQITSRPDRKSISSRWVSLSECSWAIDNINLNENFMCLPYGDNTFKVINLSSKVAHGRWVSKEECLNSLNDIKSDWTCLPYGDNTWKLYSFTTGQYAKNSHWLSYSKCKLAL